MATPSSQKADRRPISFVLTNDFDGSVTQVSPPIRPEDLARNEPSLMTPVQTLGGAYIDDFGPGLSNIQISGHTGWRGAETEDGAAAFEALRNLIWVGWHGRRQAMVDAGQSPDVVKLIFADALDNIVNVVVPGSFSLKRNRARPLLMMYNLSMTVVSDRVDPALIDRLKLLGPGDVVAGVESLVDSISRLESAASDVRDWVEASIAGPVRSYLQLTTNIMNSVVARRNEINGLVDAQASQLVTIATDLATVGRNVFLTYNAIVGLPDYIRHRTMEVANAYENAYCVLRNVFNTQQMYPDYQGLYGSSSCSSTVGGAPLSLYRGSNPFEVVLPPIQPPPTVTAAARNSIEALKSMDPVLSPLPFGQLAEDLVRISEGVVT